MLGPLFDHHEFDPDTLARHKRATAQTVSVVLPARNEEATVGDIVGGLQRAHGLVDEVVVIDDGSTDRTAAVAAAAGARVERSAAVLPELDPGSGKGNALWKSLFVTEGDVVCWLDADLRDFSPHFVVGLLGPLLTYGSVGFVKGFYDRPLLDADGLEQPTGGGRVTELVARPLIAKLFPHLAGIRQPLGGEYAGRRSLLERLPFVEGWGVELGLLIDVVEYGGGRALAQVDLGVRRHRNRPLPDLVPQAAAILGTALRRAGLGASDEWGRELVRRIGGAGGTGGTETVNAEERPPIISVPAYRRLREQSA